ncbi:MAG: hypothetical protein PHF74_04545 [Dehalococcoidales bacterium]|nr:hypothetical protein [Dehalococcoidales bacterium]
MYHLAFLIAAPILLISVITFYIGVRKTGSNPRGGVSVMSWGYNIGLLGIFVAAMIYLFA